MHYKASTPEEYIQQIPEERKAAFQKLRKTIRDHLPGGFEETMSYGMISYVVPHSLYPEGYHVDPRIPLPFISIASQKNFIGLYHMGVYSIEALSNWFIQEYPNHSRTKLDMGKSCIRLKNIDDLPYELIAKLCSKVSVEDWIAAYEKEKPGKKSK